MHLPSAALLVLVLLVSACKEDVSAKRSAVEVVKAASKSLDEALSAFHAGNYDLYTSLKSSALSDLVLVEASTDIPKYSAHTIENGICDTASVRGYYQVIEREIDPIVPLMRATGEIGLTVKLQAAEFLEGRSRNKLDSYQWAQFRDCDRIIPGFSQRISSILELAEQSRPEWRKIYMERIGNSSAAVHQETSDSRAKSSRLENLKNWEFLSEQERNYYTLGDDRVEACISAFVGVNAPDPHIASAGEVAALCRSGLK